MQFKLNKIVAVLAVAIGVTACNSGSNSTPSNNVDQTKLPVSIERNNNRSFTICGKYHHADSLADLAKESGGWGCVAGNKQIRLNPLSKQEEQDAKATGGSLAAVGVPIESFAIQVGGLNGFPQNFYNPSNANFMPLDQQSFGSCVTFSSTAGLSYLNSGYTSTVNVSALDLLDRGFVFAGNNVTNSGWDGLQNASDLLSRLSESYGYYNSYNANIASYVALADQYSYGGYTGNLTTQQLTGLPSWNSQFNTYLGYTGAPNQLLNGYTWTPIFTSTLASDKASGVVTALNAGKIVLLDFNIYDSSLDESSPACTTYGSNLLPDGNAAYVNINNTLYLEAPNGQNNNAWYWPTGCLLGGHQVWVIGYATASNGQLMFVIRNSWGYSGDQGQYYMSESYLQSAGSYAAAVYAPQQ